MMTEEKVFTGTVKAPPARGLRGEVRVPGDKSVSHRSVIFSSVAEGVTEVSGFLDGEDCLSTVSAMRALGVEIDRTAPGSLMVFGRGTRGLREPEDVIDAGNSGTTARLLMGLLAPQGFFSVITGDSTLRRRPMKRVLDPLLKMGACIWGRSEGSLLPVAISPVKSLTGMDYKSPVASAQVKSAVLLAGLYAEGETRVTEPEKSRDHTERLLKFLGADLAVEGGTVTVRPSRLKSGRIQVPGDISSAAFFMVGAMITEGSEVLIRDVGVNPTRTGVIDILRKMGGSIEVTNEREVSGEPVADLVVRSSALKGVAITGRDLVPAIDEFPVLCVAAAFAQGRTAISGGAELRVKESDRIRAMWEVLQKLGVEAEEREDGIVIEGTGGKAVEGGGTVQSLGDHRIAMAAGIAALKTASGIEIEGASSVDVSFPGFFPLLEGLRSS